MRRRFLSPISIELTLVHATTDGDAPFTSLDRAIWAETTRQRHPAGAVDRADFSYVTYRRRAAD